MNFMKISEEGLLLIKRFEGCKLQSYLCPAGVWTIGYGHTVGVKKGQTITQAQADQMLADDLVQYEQAVMGLVNDEDKLTSNQFSALVSFAYNCGVANLRSSTLLRKVNAKDYVGAANEFGKWVNGGGKVLSGLVRRREAERALFVKV